MEQMTRLDQGLDHDSFYRELTTRNGTFVAKQAQKLLRTTTILVAGCGSTGGAVVEPLVRLGAEKLILVDNGEYELNNLNRQEAYLYDINKNKATSMSEKVRNINPFIECEVLTTGITKENVDELVRKSDIIIDGVDVTETSGWIAKFDLHRAAAQMKKPVITGYDMGATQFVELFDYRETSEVFHGKLKAEDITKERPFRLMANAIPHLLVPLEMLEDLSGNMNNPNYSVPQIVYTSLLFGAIASRMVVDLLSGHKLRPFVAIDLANEVRPSGERIKATVRKYRKVVQIRRQLVAIERGKM